MTLNTSKNALEASICQIESSSRMWPVLLIGNHSVMPWIIPWAMAFKISINMVLVLSAMCFFVENGQMAAWVVAIVLLREFGVSGLRLIAVEQNRVIAAAWSGKVKTASTMVCLIAMLAFSNVDLVNIISSAIILVTTVYSGIEYFIVNRDVLKFSN